MKAALVISIAGLIGAGVLHLAQVQQAGTKRTDLQRHDLSAAGREVVQVRLISIPDTSPPGTRIRVKRSSMFSKARWSTKSAVTRSQSRPVTFYSSRPERPIRRRTLASPTGRSSPPMSSKKASRS